MVYKNYMGGVWGECDSKKTFTSTNPAHSGQVVGEFQDSNAKDIQTNTGFPAMLCKAIHKRSIEFTN